MLGMGSLLRAIDVKLQEVTGRAQYELYVPLNDPDQLSYIYREGSVTETCECASVRASVCVCVCVRSHPDAQGLTYTHRSSAKR
jgi:hypothetical protein